MLPIKLERLIFIVLFLVCDLIPKNFVNRNVSHNMIK